MHCYLRELSWCGETPRCCRLVVRTVGLHGEGGPFHIHAFTEFALPASSIVVRLAHANRFNTAMATARSLDTDMSDLFSHLVGRCLRLSRNPESVM